MPTLNWFFDLVRPSARWQRENEGFRKWFCGLLQDAIKAGADRISFMTPSECRTSQIPALGTIVPTSEAEAVRLQEEMYRIIGVNIPGEISKYPVFLRTRDIEVPIWFRVNKKWKSVDGIPIYVFHPFIHLISEMYLYDGEVDPQQDSVVLRLIDGTRVYTEFWYESDLSCTLVIGDILPPTR